MEREKLIHYTHKTKEKFVRLYCVECTEFNPEDTGEKFLTEKQYEEQLNNPNKEWQCPRCNCYPCWFDDEYFELPIK